MDAWDALEDLNTKVAAPAAPFELDPAEFTRKRTRSMGRVALMAVKTARDALEAAGLLGSDVVRSSRCGIAYGSSAGQPAAVAELANLILSKSCRGITATTYVRMMAHTAAVNIGVYFGCRGRIIPTSSACTSGSQGIGYAYEAIRFNRADVMIAGGAEELDATDAAIFDTLFATSTAWNERPHETPKPFDRHRDGLVVGEGAGTLILEEYEHAKRRGAPILAEVIGFGTNSDGAHITSPQKDEMAAAMRLALEDAGLEPADVDLVNGHGTATESGDVAESAATYEVFGSTVPYTTMKGHMGHTLGACGAPVFASFTGGAYKLADLTGGFIWGFFPVVALAGMGSSRPLSPVSIFLALTGLALCHMLGVGQYALVTGNPLPAAAVAVSLPYIAKDVLSVLLAAFAARAINARMGRDARSEAPLMRKIKNIS